MNKKSKTKKKKKFNSYLYSQKIATVASGNTDGKLGLYYELFGPMTEERMAELNKKMKFFIRKMEGIYKKNQYEDDGDAMAYFISTIQAKTCGLNEDLSPDYTKVRPLSGIFGVNDKANTRATIQEIEKNFNVLVEKWLGDLNYFADRWCYSRFITFKLTYFLICSRWGSYQSYLKNPHWL